MPFALEMPSDFGHRHWRPPPLRPRAQSGKIRTFAHIQGLRVLIAEDNPVSARIVARFVEQEAMYADVVSDGLAALERLDGGAFDLSRMDCELPNMDGFDTTLRIRERTDLKRTIPIIAVTANRETDNEARCLGVGMDAYVPKPVDPDRLIRTIRRVMGERDERYRLVAF